MNSGRVCTLGATGSGLPRGPLRRFVNQGNPEVHVGSTRLRSRNDCVLRPFYYTELLFHDK